VSGAIVIVAGGTGGHLFPAEALARELLGRGRPVHLLTDRRADALAERVPGIALHRVIAGRLDGGPVRAVRGVAELALGTLQAHRLLRRLRPAAAIGFGGYVSVPTMLAAVRLRVSTAIHEQNAVLGRANRLLARQVERIATGFPATAGLLAAAQGRVVHTGNPVRPAIVAIGDRDYRPPREGDIELLILGGSQGARALSEIVPPALAGLPEPLRSRLRISQQARPEDLGAVEACYRECGIAAELASFFPDVPERLGRAHLAICRAGASTIAELAAAGRPSVLIPYPHAADDHQAANARAIAEAGAGWVMPQAGLTSAILGTGLAALLTDPDALCRAAAQARAFSRRDAAARLADLALAGAGGRCDPVQERAA